MRRVIVAWHCSSVADVLWNLGTAIDLAVPLDDRFSDLLCVCISDSGFLLNLLNSENYPPNVLRVLLQHGFNKYAFVACMLPRSDSLSLIGSRGRSSTALKHGRERKRTSLICSHSTDAVI